MRFIGRALTVVALSGASLAFGQTSIPLTVSGNQARGTIALPGGIGAQLTISFESVEGLTPGALDVVVVSLYTHNLSLNPLVPLALYKSHDGERFRDITTWEANGSYRAGGSDGSFSEFLIVVDHQPIDTVITGKFDRLEALLNQYASSMPVDVYSVLQNYLFQARVLYQAGNTSAAIGRMSTFSQYVIAHSGAEIPDVWRADDPSLVNVAGTLRGAADTLRFSLQRKLDQPLPLPLF
jgi:hypothetical protein